jgi:DNA-directed RNA polymerase specialized sigma24 family protein
MISDESKEGNKKLKRNGSVFYEFVRDLGIPGNPQTRTLISFISNLLHSMSLNYQLDKKEILQEAVTRGLEYEWRMESEQKEERIKHPLTWLKKVVIHIIARHVKKEAKHQSGKELFEDKDLSGELVSSDGWIQVYVQEEYIHVRRAFNALTAEERDLLWMHSINDCSWKETSQRVYANGEVITEVAMRRRGFRALGKLRKLYHKLYRS